MIFVNTNFPNLILPNFDFSWPFAGLLFIYLFSYLFILFPLDELVLEVHRMISTDLSPVGPDERPE